jgi:quercetin dioxygenase-like cupin family protein
MSEAELFSEPTGDDERAGMAKGVSRQTRYRQFITAEQVPVYEGIIGVHDVRELDLGPWQRLGGNGAYLYLDGIDGIKGMFVLEVPAQVALEPERHLYHAIYYVVEGRGTTETWVDESHKQITEWGPGSLFYLPPNVHHRIVNATNERVLIIAATNAPPVFNVLRDENFIFNNEYIFSEHYRDDRDFYKYDEKVYAVPFNKRAQARTNFYPDIVHSELPLDNQRAPGFRRIQPAWSGFEDDYCGFIAQYPQGRYSRAHYHDAGAVLVCLRGRGYTYNWPVEYGPTPWKDGNADKVRVLDYVAGGLVAAAPGGGTWFHQHFGVAEEPFRVINFWGGPGPMTYIGFEAATGAATNLNISQGGHSIGYAVEDPFVREQFQRELDGVGLTNTMPQELYKNDL